MTELCSNAEVMMKTKKTDVPYGANLGFWQLLRDYLIEQKKEHYTTKEFVEDFVKTRWCPFGCPLSLYALIQKEGLILPVKGESWNLRNYCGSKANVFVSHAWQDKFVDLVRALESVRPQVGTTSDGSCPVGCCFWVDVIMVHQHKPRPPEGTPDQSLIDFFGSTPKQINRTVLVATLWNFSVLVRSWVLLEIYSSIVANIPIEVKITTDGKPCMVDMGDNKVNVARGIYIDISQSQAENPMDRDNIFRLIDGGDPVVDPTGVNRRRQNVNLLVAARLNKLAPEVQLDCQIVYKKDTEKVGVIFKPKGEKVAMTAWGWLRIVGTSIYCDGDIHVTGSVPGVTITNPRPDFVDNLKYEGCVCYSIDALCSWRTVLNKDPLLSLKSQENTVEFILYLEFKTPLSLNRLLVGLPNDQSCPRTLKVFVNKPVECSSLEQLGGEFNCLFVCRKLFLRSQFQYMYLIDGMVLEHPVLSIPDVSFIQPVVIPRCSARSSKKLSEFCLLLFNPLFLCRSFDSYSGCKREPRCQLLQYFLSSM
jgi:hypothetical protein